MNCGLVLRYRRFRWIEYSDTNSNSLPRYNKWQYLRLILLKVENVSKEYDSPGGSLKIVSDVSLSLARGEAVSIVGPSGSGKSTLLYMMGALEPPSSGTITLDDQDPFQLKDKELAAFRNKEIGFIFQDHCLLPQCTVLENVLNANARRSKGCERG